MLKRKRVHFFFVGSNSICESLDFFKFPVQTLRWDDALFHDGNDLCNLLCHVFFMHRVEMSWISVSPFPPKETPIGNICWRKKVGPGEYWWSDHQLSWPCAGGVGTILRNLACFVSWNLRSRKKRLVANIDKKTWQSYKLEDFRRCFFVGFFEWWRCGWFFSPTAWVLSWRNVSGVNGSFDFYLKRTSFRLEWVWFMGTFPDLKRFMVGHCRLFGQPACKHGEEGGWLISFVGSRLPLLRGTSWRINMGLDKYENLSENYENKTPQKNNTLKSWYCPHVKVKRTKNPLSHKKKSSFFHMGTTWGRNLHNWSQQLDHKCQKLAFHHQGAICCCCCWSIGHGNAQHVLERWWPFQKEPPSQWIRQ